MSLRNVDIYENEVVVDDAPSRHSSSHTPAVGHRYVGEGTSAGAQLSEDNRLFSQKEALNMLLKKTKLTALPSSIAEDDSAAHRPLHRSLRRGMAAPDDISPNSLAMELAALEKQLAAIEQRGNFQSAPPELVLSDAERIVEELQSAGERGKSVKRALEVLNEKIDSVLLLAKRSRASSMQGIDSDVELVNDAMSQLLTVQRLEGASQTLVQDLEKLRHIETNWPALKEQVDKVDVKEVEASTKKLDALEEMVSKLEANFSQHRDSVLAQLEAFDREIIAKLGPEEGDERVN